jgi:REP element-mobilizing transposase RayT
MEHYQFYNDASLSFVSCSSVVWLPVFVASEPCELLVQSLDFCHKAKQLRTHAYVVMPTHFHAIVSDAGHESNRLLQTLTDFRKYTGRRIADYCDGHLPECFRNTLRSSAGNDRDRRVWQPTRHPVALLTEAFWWQNLNYLHENPCRKGLVRRSADWRFSSAAWYQSDGREPCEVKLTRVVW